MHYHLKKSKIFFLIGIILIILGISSTFKEQVNNYTESKAINNFLSNKSLPKKSNNDYLMVLEIPKIKLQKGIYPLESSNNNVDKNVEILKDSQFDDNNLKNIILAGHSGNSPVAFFDDLDNLKLNDQIYIYYNHKKYTFQIYSIDTIVKNGYYYQEQIHNKQILTLITCKKNTKSYQLVIVAELTKTTSLI